jgi:hypothetical protein
MTKRPCKNCGEVHEGCPFTDCYNSETDGPLEDDVQAQYMRKYGSFYNNDEG